MARKAARQADDRPTRQLYSRLFRSAAADFLAIAQPDYEPFIRDKRDRNLILGAKPSASTIMDRCGQWVVEAHAAGLIRERQISGIVENYNHCRKSAARQSRASTSRREVQKQRPAVRVVCPLNLFLDIRGGTMVYAQQSSAGKWQLVKDAAGRTRCGGLLPTIAPGIVDRPEHEQNAAACEWIANVIETETAKPRGENRGVRPDDAARKERLRKLIKEMGVGPTENHAGVKNIIKELKRQGFGQRPPTTRRLLRELADEGDYRNPAYR